MKNYTKLLICFIFISTYGKAQFFGVGQANPSNTLHVTPINVGDEPVRIEGLQSAAAIDSAFISFDPLTGVLKALSLAELKALVNDNNVNYSAGSGISISGGIISNLGDADSDPSNEYNTAFSITGNVISLTDGGGVKTINLPPSSGNDHDWYGEGTTSSPTAITDNIFTQGNVGIGNISPLSQLEVFSGASESVLRLSTSSNLNLQLDGGTGFHQFMRYAENGVNKWEVGNASAHSNKFYFNPNAMSSIFGSVMVIEQNGNVGIGTTSPASKLHIGATTATHPLSTGNFISATSNSSDNKPVAYFETGGDAIGEPAIFAYGRGTTPITDVVTISANGTSNSNYNLLNLVHGETSAGGDGTSVMVVKGDGNVGIGTTAPTEKLEVNGTFKLTDGTEGAGKFLVSDANGVASWANGTPPIIVNSTGGSVVNVGTGLTYTGASAIVTLPGYYMISFKVLTDKSPNGCGDYLAVNIATTPTGPGVFPQEIHTGSGAGIYDCLYSANAVFLNAGTYYLQARNGGGCSSYATRAGIPENSFVLTFLK